jgi:hypothetical protein
MKYDFNYVLKIYIQKPKYLNYFVYSIKYFITYIYNNKIAYIFHHSYNDNFLFN